MLTFIKMEFLKLKRSNIFLLSLMGAILPPLLMFIAVFAFDEGTTFDMLFTNVNMYMSALFAVMLFAIMIDALPPQHMRFQQHKRQLGGLFQPNPNIFVSLD